MKLKQMWPEEAEGYELKQVLLTTYELDPAALRSLPIDTDQPEKYLIFYDNIPKDLTGSSPDGDAFAKMLVRTSCPPEKGKERMAVHGKIRLFRYDTASGCRKWHLVIHSANLTRHNNLETMAELSGTETDSVQPKNQPLIDYLQFLTEFITPETPDHEEKRRRMDAVLCGLEKVCFTPLPDCACEDYSFLIPRTDQAAFLFQPYDELLVISPFLQRDELVRLIGCGRENASCTVLSNVSSIRDLLKEGPVSAHLIPYGKLRRFVHAKIFLRRSGCRWDLFLGSMNLTSASMKINPEFMIRMTDPHGIVSVKSFLADFLGEKKQDRLQRTEDEEAILSLFDSPIFRKAALEQTRQEYLCHLLKNSRADSEAQNRDTRYLLSPQCTADLLRLERGEGLPSVPEHIRVTTGEKERDVFRLPVKEKLLLGLVNFVLHDFDGRFSPNLYSHIRDRSPNNVFSVIRSDPSFPNLWLFETDIKKYEPSMDPDVLIQTLHTFLETEPGFHDPVFCDFADRLLHRRSCTENGILITDGQAVQSGIPLSGFWGNLYLYDLDLEIGRKAAFYARCSDDLLIGARTLTELEQLIEEMKRIITEKKLQLHPEKSRIVEPGTAFSFLGWQVCGSRIDFTQEALSRIRKAIRRETIRMLTACEHTGLSREFRMLLMTEHAQKFAACLGLKTFFRVVSVPDGLREIDRMLCDMIRTAVTGKTGPGRFRVSREEINCWGYRSVINRYYRHISGRPHQDTGTIR